MAQVPSGTYGLCAMRVAMMDMSIPSQAVIDMWQRMYKLRFIDNKGQRWWPVFGYDDKPEVYMRAEDAAQWARSNA